MTTVDSFFQIPVRPKSPQKSFGAVTSQSQLYSLPLNLPDKLAIRQPLVADQLQIRFCATIDPTGVGPNFLTAYSALTRKKMRYLNRIRAGEVRLPDNNYLAREAGNIRQRLTAYAEMLRISRGIIERQESYATGWNPRTRLFKLETILTELADTAYRQREINQDLPFYSVFPAQATVDDFEPRNASDACADVFRQLNAPGVKRGKISDELLEQLLSLETAEREMMMEIFSRKLF